MFHYKNGDESYGWFNGTYKVVTKADAASGIPFEGEKVFMDGTGNFANSLAILALRVKLFF